MKKFLSVVIILISALTLNAQSKILDSIVDSYKNTASFSGVIAITVSGKPVYMRPAGVAERSSNKPVEANSLFKIASITKTFTAVIIMQLIEENKLHLEDTVNKYLPAYTGEAKNKVTIYQLLTYSSGIANYEGDSGMAAYKNKLDVDAFIATYCSGSLHFTPGSQFEYNNADYILLGKIIENITGNSFAYNLQQRILQPLQMTNSGLLKDANDDPRLAATYLFNDSIKTFTPDEAYYISDFSAAGAMYSTAEDLLKFDAGIFNHQLLKPASVTKMITADTSLQNVGIGFWFTHGYGDINTDFVYRPGGILGATANWIHVLKDDIAIIILSNTNATNLFGMTGDLYKALVPSIKLKQ